LTATIHIKFEDGSKVLFHWARYEVSEDTVTVETMNCGTHRFPASQIAYASVKEYLPL
jgi:hypothetical protein